MVKTMNKDAIIFAMANPVPEIMPEEAKVTGEESLELGVPTSQIKWTMSWSFPEFLILKNLGGSFPLIFENTINNAAMNDH